jgi:hypothetical protein
MLTRGIVGLVGRDEGADPSAYKAATPGAKARVRVGEEIGFDSAGKLAVDIEVRRSIREQGFGLPWPVSVFYFSDDPKLEVDGQPHAIKLRANGDLDLPQLVAGERVRLRLDTRRGGHLLSVETAASDRISPVQETAIGAAIRAGLPDRDDRPGWVDLVLQGAGTDQPRLEDVLRLLPRALPPRRRLAALYAFVALGLLQPSRGKWAPHPERALPGELALAFAALREDPLAYPVLPNEHQRAVVWLVRASWLVPNLGWSRVRPNDLADTGAEDDAEADTTPAVTRPRETALMRIVEAAHHAADLHRNPAGTDTVDATGEVARRYLTALGYTAFNGIREADGLGPDVLSIHRTTDGPTAALWILLPLGAGVSEREVRRARKLGREHGVPTVVTDGISLAAVARNGGPPIDLRSVGRKVKEFERVVALAADPEALLSDE